MSNWESWGPSPEDLTGTETLPINKAGVSKYTTINKIKDFIGTAYEAAGAIATAISEHLSAYAHGDIEHDNRAALNQVSGTNTGDQDAAGTPFTPADSISAITVQSAIEELSTEKAPVIAPVFTHGAYFTGVNGMVTFDLLNGVRFSSEVSVDFGGIPYSLNGLFGVGLPFLNEAADPSPNVLDYYLESTWTPNDASNASLALTYANCGYTRIGNMVFISADVTYPATADTNVAAVGGLPFNPKYPQAGSNNALSAVYSGVMAVPGSKLQFYNFPGTTPRTNAQLSGATVKVNVAYRVA